MSRKASREMSMQLLYQLEIRKDDREEQISAFLEENEIKGPDEQYVRDVVKGTLNNAAYIDSLVEKNAKGWKLGRISKVDLAILRLGIYEICFRDDIPYSVSVNEAVELAKKYSGDDAGSFINGILSKIPKMKTAAADIKANNR